MKKLFLFFGLFCMINLMSAQETKIVHLNGHDIQVRATNSVSISESDVQFWVGTGSNSTLVCIGWDHAQASYTPTVVVWGLHWNGTITLQNALDSIVAYDSRFTYAISGGFVNSVDSGSEKTFSVCEYFRRVGSIAETSFLRTPGSAALPFSESATRRDSGREVISGKSSPFCSREKICPAR